MKFLIVAVADFPQGFATAERIRLIAKTLRSGGHEAELALIHSGRHRAVTPAEISFDQRLRCELVGRGAAHVPGFEEFERRGAFLVHVLKGRFAQVSFCVESRWRMISSDVTPSPVAL